MTLFPGPRLFALPPGVDFPQAFARGLRSRLSGLPPEAMARVTVLVGTARMRQRIATALAVEPGLLPRLRLITDLGTDTPLPGLPSAVPALRRRLELSVLIGRLLDHAPDLAPRAALYDLADSLADLLDEMQGEGVPPERIAALDVSEHSAHWARTQGFMGIVAPFFAGGTAPDAVARQRMVVERLAERWRVTPPADPWIIAGSTGSRGTTLRLMQAVAALPQGALVLPGFDFAMPGAAWDAMPDALTGEDHPQFRMLRLCRALGLTPGEVARWTDDAPPSPARNALVSLSLRPAPVTDQWLTEGAALTDLIEATARMTLIEADTPRDEALSIALILRQAAEGGRVAALVTADRGLARRVTAALDRWRIRPDDSAGRPLSLTASGRLLRQTADALAGRMSGESLLALLKHPLVGGTTARGEHLLLTRDLELYVRDRGLPHPTPGKLLAWAGEAPWGQWLARCLALADRPGADPLPAHVARHRALTEALSSGPAGDPVTLWDGPAGEIALATFTALEAEAAHGGTLSAPAYRDLVEGVLARGEVRETVAAHPFIRIWGTREARIGGADLVILGGLNDGIWPDRPPPDPWLNRRMRLDAGLLLPERRIGLSAHDYQQAIAAPEVVLTRARRDAEAETVVSRWLNRLTNLLEGLRDQGGKAALDAMRERGRRWLALAATLDAPTTTVKPAPRPAPRPPVEDRPRRLSVTEVSTLIRDPYAIYARHLLGLFPLHPLRATPDARLRGTVIHRILEAYAQGPIGSETPEAALNRLKALTTALLADEVPWPAARTLWQARLNRAAPFLVRLDAASEGRPVILEKSGRATLDPDDFVLTARPDRIDLLPDARVHVIDYKTGAPPSEKQQRHFDKQLPLTAAMVERGGFPTLGRRRVARITYVGLGATPKAETTEVTPELTAAVWAELGKLIAAYMNPAKGYASRRSVAGVRFGGDYDHLARMGEWQMTDPPQPEDVG